MKKYNLIFLFFTIFTFSFAQTSKTIEVIVSGRPSWQQLIPLGKEGLILFVKSDVTKAQIMKFDTDLNKLWQSEIFLDAEKQPSAFTVDKEQVTFLFSENQGMYYQVFSVNIKTGKFDDKGFELREYFQDQDYVYLKNRVLLAGANETGAAFYNFKFEEGIGEFIPTDLKGKTQVQLFKYEPEKNLIETLWSVREVGYKDEKKKKGEFTKDAYVVYAKFDTTGKFIIKHQISSKAGFFPITAKLTDGANDSKIISGTYQSNAGSKGIYVVAITSGNIGEIHFIEYKDLLKGKTEVDDATLKKIYSEYYFLPTEPVFSNGLLSVGGTFFKPDYQTITTSNPNYNPYGYDPYGRYYNRYGYSGYQSRSQSKQVFRGYNFLNGFVASVDLDGNIIFQSRFDMNQLSPQITESLAIAENKSVAYCVNGNIGVGGVTNLQSPKILKLSDDSKDLKNQQFIAGYNGVKFWYENNFIAIGNRIKFEALKVDEEDVQKEKPSKRSKQNKQPLAQANIKKIIYLTKIDSGNQGN